MNLQEENILDYAAQEYISFPPGYTVERVQDEYLTIVKGKDVVMYIYILDERKPLRGVIDLMELLPADDRFQLKDIMEDHVHTLETDSTIKEATEKFDRDKNRAIPISDDDYILLGCVTYRDIMGLKHRFIER